LTKEGKRGSGDLRTRWGAGLTIRERALLLTEKSIFMRLSEFDEKSKGHDPIVREEGEGAASRRGGLVHALSLSTEEEAEEGPAGWGKKKVRKEEKGT